MQQLTEWQGEVDALLTEMKRRAGVSTDTELAKVLGTTQSNVSTWRRRGRVPQAVLLRFERLNLDANAWSEHRLLAARTVAIRVAERAHERSGRRGGASRWVFFTTVALVWDRLVATIAADLEKWERTHRRWPSDLASELLENDEYLDQIVDWVMSLSAGAAAPPPPANDLPQ
jgi:DNA-binding transcriptional regulator YiaG